MYSEALLELFHNPRHKGALAGFSRRSRRENPVCGDVLELSACVTDGMATQLGFQARGCPPVLAAAEWVCRWGTGKPIKEVMALSEEVLETGLGGLPRNKRHALSICLEAVAEICREESEGV